MRCAASPTTRDCVRAGGAGWRTVQEGFDVERSVEQLIERFAASAKRRPPRSVSRRRSGAPAVLAGRGLIGWTYVGFPAVVLARGRLRPRPHRTGAITPSVSIVIAARNEEASIGAKLDNLAALDYPAERLEVIVASDGSDDATNRIVGRARRPAPPPAGPRRVWARPRR